MAFNTPILRKLKKCFAGSGNKYVLFYTDSCGLVVYNTYDDIADPVGKVRADWEITSFELVEDETT